MIERLNRLLTFKRARTYAAVLVALYVVAWVYVLVKGSLPLNSAGEPIGGDYIAFHTAGRLLLSGRSSGLYDHAAVAAVQSSLLGGRIPDFYDPFRNPPFAALPFVPLALLDLLPGFAVWTLVSAGCLALSLRLLLDEAPRLRARWRGLLLLVLAFAPVYFGIIDGENATVSLLLYVLIYRALARNRDGLAGTWAALGLFKPQLFFIFPLIFIASRRWRALRSYAAVALGLGLVSIVVVGLDGMWAWLRIVVEPERSNALANAWRMVSLRSFFDTLLPAQASLALGLYLAACLVLVGAVLASWASRRFELPLAWAFTSLASVLVDPHLVDYDLTILVPAGVLAARTMEIKWLMVLLYLVAPLRPQIPVGSGRLLVTTVVVCLLTGAIWRAHVRGAPALLDRYAGPVGWLHERLTPPTRPAGPR